MKGVHNLVTLICPVCKACFSVFPAIAKRRKHCSRKCRAEFLSTRTGTLSHRFGKTLTDETKRKISESRTGYTMDKCSAWKGGRCISDGYVMIYAGLLPQDEQQLFASMLYQGYIFEHRLVVARRMGRPLTRSEEVHHINGVKSDNRDNNLEVLSSRGHKREYWELYRQNRSLIRENEVLKEKLAELQREHAYKITSQENEMAYMSQE